MKENNIDKKPKYGSFEEMLCHCKEEYCRERYDAESIEKEIIDKIILKRRNSGIKRFVSIIAAVVLVLSSSIVISKSFLSDTGYANYLIKKCIYYVSPIDMSIERLSNGSTISEIYIDKEEDLSRLDKMFDRIFEFRYIPKGYKFKYCNASISERGQMRTYVYEKENLHLYISLQEYDNSSSTTLVGDYSETLTNGAELIHGKLDDENYSASIIDVDGNVYNVIGNGDKEDIIDVAENILCVN